MTPIAQTQHTPEEYLALEREAAYKSEYINGCIYAMAGASREHIVIAGNAFGALHAQLRGGPCEAYTSDMRVKVDPTGLYTYPDISAVCDQPRFEDEHVDTLINPVLIVEVLSESTEAYDRGEKFAHYRRLPSLSEYVLIAQDTIRVERYARERTEASPSRESTGERWILTEVDEPDGTVRLDSVDGTLALRDIYDRIEF